MRKFEDWFLTLTDSIAGWKYYTDFPKVYKKTNAIKIELSILNSLIGSKDIKNDFKTLVARYPEVLKVIPILLAKRESEIKITSDLGSKVFNFKNMNYSIDDYITFMEKTGLFDLLENRIIGNLEDYVKGVEVGLDTNARKNRTGTAMEDLVEEHLISLGYIKDKTYFTQMTADEIYKQYGIDVRRVDSQNLASKRFDFVIKIENRLYAIEVNFYSGGGSKLNETARSYKMIAQESKMITDFTFIWITDGKGWLTAKNNLEETFLVLPHVYNLNDLYNKVLINVLK